MRRPDLCMKVRELVPSEGELYEHQPNLLTGDGLNPSNGKDHETWRSAGLGFSQPIYTRHPPKMPNISGHTLKVFLQH